MDYQFYDAFGNGCWSINFILPGEMVNLNPPVRLLLIKFEFWNIYFAENFWNLILFFKNHSAKIGHIKYETRCFKNFFCTTYTILYLCSSLLQKKVSTKLKNQPGIALCLSSYL